MSWSFVKWAVGDRVRWAGGWGWSGGRGAGLGVGVASLIMRGLVSPVRWLRDAGVRCLGTSLARVGRYAAP